MQNDSWWSKQKVQMVWPFVVHFSKIKLLWFSRFRCKQVSHQHSEFWVFFENWENSGTYSIHQYLPGRVKELPSFCLAPDLQSWLLLIIFHLGHFTHFHCLAGSHSHSDLQLGLKIEINIRLSKKLENYFALVYEDYRKQYLWKKSVYLNRNRDTCTCKFKPHNTWY